MLGDHNRWGKNVPYDASVGVPLVVAGPNIQHRTSDALVSLIDIAATFLDYAKAEIPDGMTALSFRPLLEGRTNDHREYVTSGLLNWRMVRDKRYKLIEGFDPSLMKSYGSVPKGTKRPIVLFDLQEDPNESNNIASQQPEIVASMKKRLPTRNSDPSYGFPKPEDFANYGKRS
nr:sulfatase/phosphatase domain-containing protein [Providencia sp. G1(2023)]